MNEQNPTPPPSSSPPAVLQRATKLERQAVADALRSIWSTASESTHPVEFLFPPTPAGRKECRSLYDGLTNFRKRVEKRKLEDFHLWKQISSLMLCKSSDDTKVYFRRKFGEVSGRSLVILNAAARLAKAVDTSIVCPVVRELAGESEGNPQEVVQNGA